MDKYVHIVRDHAQTGQPGDGAIFVSDVEKAVHVRTGNRNEAALV